MVRVQQSTGHVAPSNGSLDLCVGGESKVKLSGTLIRYSNEICDGDMTINSVLAKISYQEQSRYRDY